MKQTLRLLTALLLLSCMLGACKKEMFNANTAQKITELSFHNDFVHCFQLKVYLKCRYNLIISWHYLHFFGT